MTDEDRAATPDPGAHVRAALDRLAPEGSLGVAVSGGGDSTALLTIAAGWALRRGRELRAVTVDHGLRAESAAEAVFAGRHAARLGVAHHVLQAGPMAPGNLPAAARAARYGLMAEWARAAGLAAVALGHTMDDQAETVLMRLARGSGVEGLSAMAPRRDRLGVTWIRPMLEVRRAALRDWLRARGIAWVDDPTNEDAGFNRIRARRALAHLAPLGLTVEGLAATARTLARQRRVLARAAADLDARAVRHGTFGEARIALAPLREAERDTALRLVGDLLARIGGHAHRPRFRSLEPVLDALLDAGGHAVTLAGCLVVPDGAGVLICREPAAVAGPVALSAEVVWDRRWRVTPPAALAGDWQVGALGVAGCDALRRLAREGAWRPPEAWSAAPRAVRETVPAIRPATEGAPVAVPPAGWTAADAPPGFATIAASVVAAADGPC